MKLISLKKSLSSRNSTTCVSSLFPVSLWCHHGVWEGPTTLLLGGDSLLLCCGCLWGWDGQCGNWFQGGRWEDDAAPASIQTHKNLYFPLLENTPTATRVVTWLFGPWFFWSSKQNTDLIQARRWESAALLPATQITPRLEGLWPWRTVTWRILTFKNLGAITLAAVGNTETQVHCGKVWALRSELNLFGKQMGDLWWFSCLSSVS